MRHRALMSIAAVLVGFVGLYIGVHIRKTDGSKGKINVKKNMAKRIDLTAELSEQTTVFPGDPPFESQRIASLEKSSYFNLFRLCLCNHMGTHIDFPAHVIKNGKTSSDYSLSDLEGDGLIIEVPKEYMCVDKSFIKKEQHKFFKNAIVFFKTSNSEIPKTGKIVEDYVYIDLEAAKELVDLKVKMVGIDYLSVDKYESEKLPVHNILLSNNILIIENLELNNAEPGQWTLSAMPLKIPQMDGLPVRVSMTR